MVRVSLRRDRQGRIRELSCRGHARFEQDGADIVCAGVSAVLGMLGLGLTRASSQDCVLEAGDGRFRLLLPGRRSEGADLLVETAALALEELEQHYTGYIQVRLLKPR